jgi:Crp-like helix-turn-helix protein
VSSRCCLAAGCWQDAEIALRLYEAISRGLVATREHLLSVGQRGACERLATFLLVLSRKNEARGDDSGMINLPMTRIDIADFLGLTLETVSRTFSKMKRQGLIEIDQTTTIRLKRTCQKYAAVVANRACTLGGRVSGRGVLAGRVILVLEDEPLVALDVQAALESADAQVVVANTLEDGLRLARCPRLSAAILDISFGPRDCNGICWRIALALERCGYTQERLSFAADVGSAGGPGGSISRRATCSASSLSAMGLSFAAGGVLVAALPLLVVMGGGSPVAPADKPLVPPLIQITSLATEAGP